MAQTPLTITKTVDDWLIRQWEDAYCREIVTFRNATAGALSYTNGLVLEIATGKYVPVATAANAAAILLENLNSVAATSDVTTVVLKRGPALVNEDQLGIQGLTLATIMTALAALSPPILAYKQPIKTTSMAA
jgi:hypothetical protein